MFVVFIFIYFTGPVMCVGVNMCLSDATSWRHHHQTSQQQQHTSRQIAAILFKCHPHMMRYRMPRYTKRNGSHVFSLKSCATIIIGRKMKCLLITLIVLKISVGNKKWLDCQRYRFRYFDFINVCILLQW